MDDNITSKIIIYLALKKGHIMDNFALKMINHRLLIRITLWISL